MSTVPSTVTEVTDLGAQLATLIEQSRDTDEVRRDEHGAVTGSSTADAILALLCPPNHLLLNAEAVIERDAGINTPDAYEPAYSYGAFYGITVLADTLSEEHAVFLGFAGEQAEMFPDGTSDLEKHLVKKYEPLLVAAQENATEKQHNPTLFLK